MGGVQGTMSYWTEYVGEEEGPAPFVIIIGDIGSGKTASAMSIVDEYRDQYKDVYLLMDKKAFKNYKGLGFKRIDPEAIRIPTNSIFVADDLHLSQHARDWGKGKGRPLEELARERRQTNTMMIVTTQVSRVIDVNLLNMMSCLLIMRPSIAQAKFDRGEIAPMLRKAYQGIGYDEYGKAYCFSNEGEGYDDFIDGIPLPGWYTDEISNAHRDHFGGDVQETPGEVAKEPLNNAFRLLKAIGKAVK